MIDKYKADSNIKEDLELFFGTTKLENSQTPKSANLPNNSLITVKLQGRRITVESYLSDSPVTKVLTASAAVTIKEIIQAAVG